MSRDHTFVLGTGDVINPTVASIGSGGLASIGRLSLVRHTAILTPKTSRWKA